MIHSFIQPWRESVPYYGNPDASYSNIGYCIKCYTTRVASIGSRNGGSMISSRRSTRNHYTPLHDQIHVFKYMQLRQWIKGVVLCLKTCLVYKFVNSYFSKEYYFKCGSTNYHEEYPTTTIYRTPALNNIWHHQKQVSDSWVFLK